VGAIQKKTFVMSLTLLLIVVATMILAFSAETNSAVATLNPAGVLAATFTAVVGLAWFVKNH